jgi:hypothetical protein
MKTFQGPQAVADVQTLARWQGELTMDRLKFGNIFSRRLTPAVCEPFEDGDKRKKGCISRESEDATVQGAIHASSGSSS